MRAWRMRPIRSRKACRSCGRKLKDEGGVLLPFLNAASMATELYLKSLATTSKGVSQEDGVSIVYATPERGHRTTDLLDSIAPELVAKLEAAFATWPGNRRQTFRERCAAYDDLFQASRYPFEEKLNIGGLKIEPLLDLVAFLKVFVNGYPREEFVQFS